MVFNHTKKKSIHVLPRRQRHHHLSVGFGRGLSPVVINIVRTSLLFRYLHHLGFGLGGIVSHNNISASVNDSLSTGRVWVSVVWRAGQHPRNGNQKKWNTHYLLPSLLSLFTIIVFLSQNLLLFMFPMIKIQTGNILYIVTVINTNTLRITSLRGLWPWLTSVWNTYAPVISSRRFEFGKVAGKRRITFQSLFVATFFDQTVFGASGRCRKEVGNSIVFGMLETWSQERGRISWSWDQNLMKTDNEISNAFKEPSSLEFEGPLLYMFGSNDFRPMTPGLMA